MKIKYELPQERLASYDKKGGRVNMHPAQVHGPLRNRRTFVEAFLVIIFLVLPLININGHPAVLLDIGHREFYLFGARFWAHNAPLLFLIIASFFIGLMAVTAFWGRIWCGWACPQTVFIDLVYRKIEEWIEGDSRSRKILDAAPMSLSKFSRRSLKWGIFSLVSLFLAHAFLSYFVGWKQWPSIYSAQFNDYGGTLALLIILTLIFLIDFGWFRELFCIIACPYGRWISVWMDKFSLVVDYDYFRGEPRRGVAQLGEKQGDCVNCYRCVQVCPTGIDIRRGVQPECIACTACVEACNDVMKAFGKKPGLIRYTSHAQLRDEKSRESKFNTVLRARPLLYSSIVVILMATLVILLSTQPPAQVYVQRTVGPPYLKSQNAKGALEIVNTFSVALVNNQNEPVVAEFKPDSTQPFVLDANSKDIDLDVAENKRIMMIIKTEQKEGEHLMIPKVAHLKLELTGKKSLKVKSLDVDVGFVSP